MKNKIFHRFVYITVIYFLIYLGILVLSRFYVCPFQKYFGIKCFGCGMTRAFFAILNMNFSKAWNLNPMVFPLFIAVIIFYLWFIIKGDKIIKKIKNYISR